jgi:PIN domain nuclease of toxin-antitoxin system
VYLAEKGRIAPNLFAQLYAELAAGSTGLRLADLTLDVAASLAKVSRSDVPDMPDRIVAATALHLGMPLISRDRKIQLSPVPSVW